MEMSIDMQAIFGSLPEEKQRAIARKLVNEQLNNPMTHTVIIMPEFTEDGEVDASKAPTASGLNMKQIVDEYGIEYAEELMMNILKNGGVTTKVMDGKSISALMDKCSKGIATPEEYAMANMMLRELSKNRFGRNDGTILHTKVLLDLLHYTKNKQHVQMYFVDIMNSVFLTMLGSMINMDGTPMARFNNAGPSQCVAMAEKIADDIDKSLMESIFVNGKPSNQYMVLGLYALAMRYATKDEVHDKMYFTDAEKLNDMFCLENKFDDYSEDSSADKNSEKKD